MRILLVEDDSRIAAFVKQGLRESGYTVVVRADGTDGYLDARYNPYDLIVLDLLLPGMDGIAIAGRLRTEGVRTPILMLTALDAESDKVRGLDAGADDYLTKPFGFGEFLARVRALLRRDTLHGASVLRVADLAVDTTTRTVTRAGREIPLSAREYALLEYLMHDAGRVAPRGVLMEKIWGDTDVESNVLEVYIGYLRQKLDAPFDTPLIHTVRGVGYSIRAPS